MLYQTPQSYRAFKMKRLLFALLLLTAVNLQAQQVIRPSTCNHKYEEIQLPSSPDTVVTNWLFDVMYRDLQQGRTYRRQTSYNGRDWNYEGAVIVVPEIPGATATFTDGIVFRLPPGVQFQSLRLTVDPTNSLPAMKRQMELVMADQPIVRTWYGAKKKKLTKPFSIKIPPNGTLTYAPVKSKR